MFNTHPTVQTPVLPGALRPFLLRAYLPDGQVHLQRVHATSSAAAIELGMAQWPDPRASFSARPALTLVASAPVPASVPAPPRGFSATDRLRNTLTRAWLAAQATRFAP